MSEKLFDASNPNAVALVVPQEQGGDEEDTYFGSIGDATNRHVSNLSHNERQMWQELVHTKDGNIFRTEPSYNMMDRDPHNLSGRDLKDYFEKMKDQAGKKLDSSGLAAISEVFQEEEQRRATSEDVYDKADLIPYHLMEQFPGMEKHIEIPNTPKDMFIYMGNTRQEFYDSFPEGHPDSAGIRRCIQLLDRENTNEKWYDFVRGCLKNEEMKPYVKNILSTLIDEVETQKGDLTNCVEVALQKIDDIFHIEYINEAAELCKKDGILQLLIHKEKEWKEATEQNFNVYSSIKTFGKVLYDNYRDKMRRHHWSRYRRIRNKYAPKVIIRGIDINRCRLQDLAKALRLSREAAIRVWHARPFESLGGMINQGYIGKNSFSDSDEMDQYLKVIENAAMMAEQKNSLQVLSEATRKLIQIQASQEKSPDQQQAWRMIWSYYRVIRDELMREINKRKENVKENGLRFLEDNREEPVLNTVSR